MPHMVEAGSLQAYQMYPDIHSKSMIFSRLFENLRNTDQVVP